MWTYFSRLKKIYIVNTELFQNTQSVGTMKIDMILFFNTPLTFQQVWYTTNNCRFLAAIFYSSKTISISVAWKKIS